MRTRVYFVSDVHLGLDVKNPALREARFVSFLKSIPAEETKSLYLLGDIWDFWYEYRDVVPKGSFRVFTALTDLIDAGVEVYFFPGNHDTWAYSYFESLGIKVLEQPYVTQIFGSTVCMGHGDGLGPGMRSYKLMRTLFRSRLLQALFSTLHPWLAFSLGKNWSKKSRLAKSVKYEFKGESEPLYRFAQGYLPQTQIDFFIFGHYHTKVDLTLERGSRLLVLDDWMDGSDFVYLYFDGISTLSGHSIKIEK